MIICGVGGYFGSRLYFTKKQEKKEEKQAQDMIDDAQLDTISKNLIYVWDEEKGRITDCVLEVFNTEEHKMDYITIPTSGQITISSDMYKKICLVNSEIPQVFKLSKLCNYFEDGDDNAYGYGVLVLEDFFNIDISYYTVVDAKVFDEAFESNEVEVDINGNIEGEGDTYEEDKKESEEKKEDSEDEDAGDNPYEHDDRFVTNSYADVTTQSAGSTQSAAGATTEEDEDATVSVKVKMLRSDYMEEMSQYKDANDLEKYLKKQCDQIKSNLAVKNKLSYVEDYLQLTETDYSYHCIPGYYENKVYNFRTDRAAKLFKKCNVAEKPKEKSKKSKEKEETVKVSDIIILNSTGTTGVAAGWSTTLTEKGYHVVEVGNYSTTLTDTQIVVKEEGQGEELLDYFRNAEIVVGDVPDTAQAQIIIGTNDINH